MNIRPSVKPASWQAVNLPYIAFLMLMIGGGLIARACGLLPIQ